MLGPYKLDFLVIPDLVPGLRKEDTMNASIIRLGAALAAISLCGSLLGCADMNRRDRDTAIGATGGAVIGGLLTDGSHLGAVGGAVVGGVIGDQTGKRR